MRHVGQGNMGCFVACVAMLLDIRYEESFKLIHPKHKYSTYSGRYEKDWIADWCIAYAKAEIKPHKAIKRLGQLGLKPRITKIKSLGLIKKTSIIFVRWKIQPTLMHCVIYDAKTKTFRDPQLPLPLTKYQRHKLQFQVDTVIYLEKFK